LTIIPGASFSIKQTGDKHVTETHKEVASAEYLKWVYLNRPRLSCDFAHLYAQISSCLYTRSESGLILKKASTMCTNRLFSSDQSVLTVDVGNGNERKYSMAFWI